MTEIKKIPVGSGYIEALAIKLQEKSLVVLRGSKGYVMCGYLNMSVAEKFNDVAVMITGVSTIEEALAAQVHSVSPAASALGIKAHQPVKEVLSIIA